MFDRTLPRRHVCYLCNDWDSTPWADILPIVLRHIADVQHKLALCCVSKQWATACQRPGGWSRLSFERMYDFSWWCRLDRKLPADLRGWKPECPTALSVAADAIERQLALYLQLSKRAAGRVTSLSFDVLHGMPRHLSNRQRFTDVPYPCQRHLLAPVSATLQECRLSEHWDEPMQSITICGLLWLAYAGSPVGHLQPRRLDFPNLHTLELLETGYHSDSSIRDFTKCVTELHEHGHFFDEEDAAAFLRALPALRSLTLRRAYLYRGAKNTFPGIDPQALIALATPLTKLELTNLSVQAPVPWLAQLLASARKLVRAKLAVRLDGVHGGATHLRESLQALPRLMLEHLDLTPPLPEALKGRVNKHAWQNGALVDHILRASPQLKALTLRNGEVGCLTGEANWDPLCLALRNCRSLTSFAVPQQFRFGASDGMPSSRALERLTHLPLRMVPQPRVTSNTDIIRHMRRFPHLTELILNGCSNAGPHGASRVGPPLTLNANLAAAIASLTSLVKLELDGLCAARDEHMATMHLPCLRSLSLEAMPHLSDLTIEHAVTRTPKLQHLELKYLRGITDRALRILACGQLPMLRTCTIWGCTCSAKWIDRLAEALEDADGTIDCVPGTRDCRGTVHVEQCCIICDATLHVCPALTCRLRDDTATVGATCDGCGRHICVDCKNDCVGGHDPSSNYVDEDLYGGCNHESLFAGLC